MLFLSGRTPNQRRWWEAFASEVSNDLLEDICHQILDLYQTTNPEQPQDSPVEEEVSPGTPKRHRPASPPPQPKIKVSETVIRTERCERKTKGPMMGSPGEHV